MVSSELTHKLLKSQNQIDEVIIPYKRFRILYENKIDPFLEEKSKFKFKEMNVLLTAYEFWRYEFSNVKKENRVGGGSGSIPAVHEFK